MLLKLLLKIGVIAFVFAGFVLESDATLFHLVRNRARVAPRQGSARLRSLRIIQPALPLAMYMGEGGRTSARNTVPLNIESGVIGTLPGGVLDIKLRSAGRPLAFDSFEILENFIINSLPKGHALKNFDLEEVLGVCDGRVLCRFTRGEENCLASVHVSTGQCHVVPFDPKWNNILSITDFSAEEAVGTVVEGKRLLPMHCILDLVKGRWDVKTLDGPEIDLTQISYAKGTALLESDVVPQSIRRGVIVGNTKVRSTQVVGEELRVSEQKLAFVNRSERHLCTLPGSGPNISSSANCISGDGNIIGGSIGNDAAVWAWVYCGGKSATYNVCPAGMSAPELLPGNMGWTSFRLKTQKGVIKCLSQKGCVAGGSDSFGACLWIAKNGEYEHYALESILREQNIFVPDEVRFSEVVWISRDLTQLLVQGEVDREEIPFFIQLNSPLASAKFFFNMFSAEF